MFVTFSDTRHTASTIAASTETSTSTPHKARARKHDNDDDDSFPSNEHHQPAKQFKAQQSETTSISVSWPTPDSLSHDHYITFHHDVIHMLEYQYHLPHTLCNIITSYMHTEFLFVWQRCKEFMKFYRIFTKEDEYIQAHRSGAGMDDEDDNDDDDDNNKCSVPDSESVSHSSSSTTQCIDEQIAVFEMKMTNKLNELMKKNESLASLIRTSIPHLFPHDSSLLVYHIPSDMRDAFRCLSDDGSYLHMMQYGKYGKLTIYG